MPVYSYSCAECGSFDHRRPAEQSSAPLPCPRCDAATTRVYTVPATPSRAGALAMGTDRERATIRRALSGEPSATGGPSGARLPRQPHRH